MARLALPLGALPLATSENSLNSCLVSPVAKEKKKGLAYIYILGVTSLAFTLASPFPSLDLWIIEGYEYWDGYGGHTGLSPISGAPIVTNKNIRHPVPLLEYLHILNKDLQEDI